MTKHTPGPWTVARYRDSDGQSLSVTALVDGSPWEVAQAIGWGGDGKDQAGANARLIAAAPDLLKSLESLEPFLDAIVCYASSMEEHEPNRLVVEARKAIAKAEGTAATH